MKDKYTKNMFKAELLENCKCGYDPIVIAKKAYHLFHVHQHEIDLDLREKMLDIITMEEGPEFEMTEDEFKNFLDEM